MNTTDDLNTLLEYVQKEKEKAEEIHSIYQQSFTRGRIKSFEKVEIKILELIEKKSKRKDKSY